MCTILSILFPVLSIMAGYDGRYYSVRNHHGASSPGVMVFCGIVGIILVFLLMIPVLKEENRDTQEKGCLTTIFVVAILICIFGIMKACD